MRYMESFNRRLRQVRKERGLSVKELADLCGVEARRIQAWETLNPKEREYPGVNELLDLCVRTESALEMLVDLSDHGEEDQLELPGLTFRESCGLTQALEELEKELEKIQLTDEEAELLRRFRRTTPENRKMILQLLTD